MNEAQMGIFWLIIGTISLFIMIFGFRYMSNKENMAMIDKGINFKDLKVRPAPFRSLKWSLLFIGVGGGLFAAYLLHMFVMPLRGFGHRNEGIFFAYCALITLGGGLGLYRSYQIERKWWDKEEEKEERKSRLLNE